MAVMEKMRQLMYVRDGAGQICFHSVREAFHLAMKQQGQDFNTCVDYWCGTMVLYSKHWAWYRENMEGSTYMRPIDGIEQVEHICHNVQLNRDSKPLMCLSDHRRKLYFVRNDGQWRHFITLWLNTKELFIKYTRFLLAFQRRLEVESSPLVKTGAKLHGLPFREGWSIEMSTEIHIDVKTPKGAYRVFRCGAIRCKDSWRFCPAQQIKPRRWFTDAIDALEANPEGAKFRHWLTHEGQVAFEYDDVIVMYDGEPYRRVRDSTGQYSQLLDLERGWGVRGGRILFYQGRSVDSLVDPEILAKIRAIFERDVFHGMKDHLLGEYHPSENVPTNAPAWQLV